MKRFSILVLLCISTAALAQKADAAFVIGGSFVSDTNGRFVVPAFPFFDATFKTDHHIFLEGELGVRLMNAHVAALYAELPIAGIPSQQVSVSATGISGVPTDVDHLATVFITPGIRLKLVPSAPISPWVSAGGGWAHYSLKDASVSQNKGALQFGGGLDFKTGLPVLGFRAEVRDFLTGDPDFGFSSLFNVNSGLHHHNLLVGGGVVLRF